MLNPDFREFLRFLDDSGARYLVVGGYAVAFHGYPRYTKDLDVWVEATSENAVAVLKALNSFGFGSIGLTAEDFIKPTQVVQLGYPPCRIDLMTSASGVDFEACFSARVETEIDGVRVNFISLEDLKKNKRASGRFQDLADLENLS